MSAAYLVVGSNNVSCGATVTALRERIKPRFIYEYGFEGVIGIGDVRRMQEQAGIAPGGDEQWFFLYRADSMTREAGHALLKILEEPPESARFFLFVTSFDSVLQTLRSRLTLIREREYGNVRSIERDEEEDGVRAEDFFYEELSRIHTELISGVEKGAPIRSLVRRGTKALALVDRAITRKHSHKYLIESYNNIA